MDNKKLIIIDSNSIVHRAFHALPPLTNKKGQPIGAVYGFFLAFFRAIKDFQPDFVVTCFDLPGPTFRHKKFKQYKAKRPKAPQSLYDQIPIIKDILESLNVPIFGKQGFEADDIIGTIAKIAPRKQVVPALESIIMTGDKDALQLVDKKTKVFLLARGIKNAILYDEEEVIKKHGITPEQILDYKALRGDPSDNIPGVTGIGEKTATMLLNKFFTLEKIYKEIEENSAKSKELKPGLRNLLIQYKEQAFLSKYLATINKDVPIDFQLKKSQWGNYKESEVISFLSELGFHGLIKRLLRLKVKELCSEENKKNQPVRKNLKMF
ncbi:MAG: 5'-3' exonuclease H3TH domain-containing protein [Patescibacteria group bacterium]